MKTTTSYRTPKTLLSLIALFLLTVCIASCGKSDNGSVGLSAYVTAVNSAEASAPQDAYVDNNKLNSSAMAYTQATAYVAVKTGDHQVQFKTAGTTTVNNTSSLSTEGNNYYTVFYTEDKSTVTTHDEHTAPSSGKARVRFINLSSAVASNVDFGLAAGSKIVSGLAYKVASAYYDVDAATTFSLYAAGSSTVMLSIPATIQAGHIYTIYVSGATQATVTYHVLVQN
ncbi:MAG: DUF4397 domain-containing protein [Bacteroidota bacterium]